MVCFGEMGDGGDEGLLDGGEGVGIDGVLGVTVAVKGEEPEEDGGREGGEELGETGGEGVEEGAAWSVPGIGGEGLEEGGEEVCVKAVQFVGEGVLEGTEGGEVVGEDGEAGEEVEAEHQLAGGVGRGLLEKQGLEAVEEGGVPPEEAGELREEGDEEKGPVVVEGGVAVERGRGDEGRRGAVAELAEGAEECVEGLDGEGGGEEEGLQPAAEGG